MAAIREHGVDLDLRRRARLNDSKRRVHRVLEAFARLETAVGTTRGGVEAIDIRARSQRGERQQRGPHQKDPATASPERAGAIASEGAPSPRSRRNHHNTPALVTSAAPPIARLVPSAARMRTSSTE